MEVKTMMFTAEEVEKAAALLRNGEVVAFPTETVYGLGANALDREAVEKIFQAKGRPQDNPLIVHCFTRAQLTDLVTEIPPEAKILMDKFWPGPLTLVLPKSAAIPQVVSAGLDTVGIRIPDHPLALELIQKTGFPLAAPSANLSGRPSPTRAEHVWADLQGKIPAILDGGETGWGLESTVLDCTVKPFRLLRPGGVTLEELQALTSIQVDTTIYGASLDATPASPGMKYQHYAPQAEVFLVLGQNTPAKIGELSEDYLEVGKRVGVMTWDERCQLYPRLTCLPMGPSGDLSILATKLYHLLRESDRLGLDVLFIEGVSEEHLGLAIMNRLRKAANEQVIHT